MPNLQTALRLASHDKEFAEALLQNPEHFQTAFNLTQSQVNGLKKSLASGLQVGGLTKADYVGS